MKKMILAAALTWLAVPALAAHEITLHTAKVGEAIHWMPEKVEVTQGEEVKFTLKHDLEGGSDFHGFFVPELKIAKQVNRHKPEVVDVKIPAGMKPGKYKLGCQFHPKHVPAVLIVKAAAPKKVIKK